MKIEAFASVLAATLLTGSAYAQDSTSVSASTSRVATPTTPAPVIVTTQAPAPNQIVYTPQLPTVADLSNAAAAQGLTVERIEQSSTQIVAVYKYANGQTNTVAYQTLPPATGTTGTTTTVAPSTTVIYESSPRIVYAYDPFYDPFWYPPFAVRVGVGFGFRGGYGYRGGYGGFHGGYGGGFHHGR